MAEELFQFLLKLKEDGVDLYEVSFWTNKEYTFLEFYDFSFNLLTKEITLG